LEVPIDSPEFPDPVRESVRRLVDRAAVLEVG